MVVIAQPADFVIDNLLQLLELLAHGENLVDLLLVLADGEPDASVVEHIDHLFGDRVRVDRHRHGAQRLDRRKSPVEARPVVSHDRNLVAGLQPDCLQAQRKRADLVGEIGPAPAFPDTKILVPHCSSRAEPFGVQQQILRKGVRGFRPGLHRSRHVSLFLPCLGRALQRSRNTFSGQGRSSTPSPDASSQAQNCYLINRDEMRTRNRQPIAPPRTPAATAPSCRIHRWDACS